MSDEENDDVCFRADYDDEGVYLYQAYSDDIAEYSLAHQRLGGPSFDPARMTWAKPSFGWLLYRSGYGRKHGQHRLLRFKVPHEALGLILAQCHCVDTNKATRGTVQRTEGAGGGGRVQWDPERDLMVPDGREPRAMLRRRAIQIGMAGRLSEQYVASIVAISDFTALGHRVGLAHREKKDRDRIAMMEALCPELPRERLYVPRCPHSVLVSLGMMPGPTADAMGRMGRGKAT